MRYWKYWWRESDFGEATDLYESSGESVRAVMDFYKLDPENDIIVISDDINLATGRIRIEPRAAQAVIMV